MEAHLPNFTEKVDQFTHQLKHGASAMQKASQQVKQFTKTAETAKKLNDKQ